MNGNTAAAAQPRLPQIDPVTFAALTALDGFIARAALTRQEHAEANQALQHLVQTLELQQHNLQSILDRQDPSRRSNGAVAPALPGNPASEDQPTIPAETAEHLFNGTRGAAVP